MTALASPQPTRRGTSNRNDRGSTHNRRARRRWLMETWAADASTLDLNLARCFRCGALLVNPDDLEGRTQEFVSWLSWKGIRMLTVDRIIPGCQGGTYARNNIRPACGPCNSSIGGGVRK